MRPSTGLSDSPYGGSNYSQAVCGSGSGLALVWFCLALTLGHYLVPPGHAGSRSRSRFLHCEMAELPGMENGDENLQVQSRVQSKKEWSSLTVRGMGQGLLGITVTRSDRDRIWSRISMV